MSIVALPPYSPPWLSLAEKELGQSEISGFLHNKRILEYHAATTLKASSDEIPWCSSFVNWCLLECGFGATRKANARSWLEWGVDLRFPPCGAIAVLKRGNNPVQGHVGFLVFDGRDKIQILGGNQGDKVSIASFPKKDVLGYRWPK